MNKSQCVVSFTPEELAAVSRALEAAIASPANAPPSELTNLLHEFKACQEAAPTASGVPSIIQQIIAMAFAGRA